MKKFVNTHAGHTFVKSKAKNRSGKKFKRGGPGKHPPTVQQKMKSFGGVY